MKSKDIDNETEEAYHPFSLHRDESDEDHHPFSLIKDESINEIDEDYHPFSLHRDEVSEEQTGEEDIAQKEEGEELYENIDSQSTVLVQRESNKDGETCNERAEEYSEQEKNQTEDTEEIIVPDPEEYEKVLEPLYDPDEIDFIRDMEELGRILREAEEEQGVSEEVLDRYENIGFEAEQYFRKLKERDQDIRKEDETQKTNENEEELIKEKVEEEIKEITSDNEPEEEPKNYPKEVESEYEAEYFINAEENLHAEGKSSEEIAKEMQQTEASYELNEEVETLYEQQEKEKLKSINQENEEEDDEIEEIDKIDVIEHVVDKEEEFQQQGMPQEEINLKIESSINEFYQKEKEEYQQKEKEKEIKEDIILEQTVPQSESSNGQEIEEITQTSLYDNKKAKEPYFKTEDHQEIKEIASESEDVVEFSKEGTIKSIKDVEKTKKEKFDIEELEELQQLYREETGKRPIYAGENTKGFCQWLEQQKIKKEELEEKDEKEQVKEKWKRILTEWMEHSEKNLLSFELKLILTELLQNAEVLEELIRKCVSKEITEKKRDHWKILLKTLQWKYPIHSELYHYIREFRTFVQESHPWDIPHIKTKFLKHLSKKYKNLKLDSKFSRDEIKFFKNHGIDWRLLKSRWAWVTKELLIPFFLETLYVKNNRVPKTEEIEHWGYGRFLKILREKYNITLSKLVEKANKTPHKSLKNEKNFSDEEKFFLINKGINLENLNTRWEWVKLDSELAVDFYKEVLFPKFNRRPTTRELKK